MPASITETADSKPSWWHTHRFLPGNLAIWIGLAAILCIYARIEIVNFTPAYREADPDGYLVLAKRIAHGGPLAVKDDDIFSCQSHVWVENSRGEVIPKFAPGYPAVMAAFYLAGGDEAMFWVNPVCGFLTLIGAFLLFRLWISPFGALMGTACLAANKMFLVYAGFMLSHALDICVVTWGMYFLFKWRRDGKWAAGAAAGLVLGFACAVRHTGILLAIVVFIAVAERVARYIRHIIVFRRKAASGPVSDDQRPGWSQLVSACVLLIAYAIFPCLLGLYNKAVFGSPFISGYYLSGEQYAFSLDQFFRFAPPIVDGLASEAMFLTFAVGLVGLLVVGPWPEALMRLFWVLPLFATHASYYWAGGKMEMIRFFISTFPVFIGLAFAVVEKVSPTQGRRLFLAAVFTAMVIGFQYDQTKSGVKQGVSHPGTRALVEAGRMLAKAVEDDAVVFSRWPSSNYIGTLRNFRFYDLRQFSPRYGWNSGWVVGPKQQPSRFNRLREFYRTHDYQEMGVMKMALLDSLLRQGRQVVFLIHRGTESGELARLGRDYELVLLPGFDGVPVEPPETGQWGLYELRKKVAPEADEEPDDEG